jgi:hypothetical protein
MLPTTLQFLIVMIASAINDRLQRELDYVEEERRILRPPRGRMTAGVGFADATGCATMADSPGAAKREVGPL